MNRSWEDAYRLPLPLGLHRLSVRVVLLPRPPPIPLTMARIGSSERVGVGGLTSDSSELIPTPCNDPSAAEPDRGPVEGPRHNHSRGRPGMRGITPPRVVVAGGMTCTDVPVVAGDGGVGTPSATRVEPSVRDTAVEPSGEAVVEVARGNMVTETSSIRVDERCGSRRRSPRPNGWPSTSIGGVRG